MQHTLNELYSEFMTGELDRSRLEGLIYRYLVYNQEKTCISHWKHDEYEDFISWFYPRLKMAIDSYRETGSSFEAFMSKYLLISSKEYHVRTTTNSVIEYSAWLARIPEMYAHEEPPVYIHKNAGKVITQLVIDKKGRRNSRRILALVLKCYYYISDDFAEKIAPMIGITAKELAEMLSKIRETRKIRDDKIYCIKERIYRQFYRCIIYDKRLTLLKENTAAFKKLELRLQKARSRLEKMRKNITSIRTEATNKQIAEVMGTTKGTVDASLSRLKMKWENMSKKAGLN